MSREKSALILTATIRLARELRQEHDSEQRSAGLATWRTARILPLNAWLSELWTGWLYSRNGAIGARPLRQAEEQELWDQIIRKASAGLLLDAAATAQLAQNAWKLVCDGQLPLDAAEWSESEDAAAFRSWAGEFRRRCQGNGWFSGAELSARVADLILQGDVPVPGFVELVGFLEPTPAQNQFFKTLEDCGVEVRERAAPDCQGGAVRVGLADTASEVRSAAEWARRILEKDAQAADPAFRIGIVVPGLTRLRGQIERVFGEVFHPRTRLKPDLDPKRLFNISLGLPGSEYPVIGSAFLMLQTNPASIPMALASRLVRSPFLPGAARESTNRALLDARLRSLEEYHISLGDIIALAAAKDKPHSCPGLLQLCQAWVARHEEQPARALPSEWAKTFAVLLRTVGWPGDRGSSSTEYQVQKVWNELLSEIAGLDGVCGSIRRHQAVRMLKRTASATLFQPQSEPAPVQIMGLFEAAGLRFDRLWLMGMHENAWPAAPAFNPFVPLRLQRRRGLARSTPELELAFANALTARFLASAPSVVVSYPGRDVEADVEVSPLLAHLPEQSAADLGLPDANGFAAQLLGSAALESIDDGLGPPCSEARLEGGTVLFKLQAACPFRAFAELRLGARKYDLPEPGLSALDRGRLVHAILERFWHQVRSHEALVLMPDDRLSDMVRSCAKAEIEEFSERRRMLRRAGLAEIEQSRLERIVGQWLALEKEREPFEVLVQEENVGVSVGGIDVSIRIDRVDRLHNDELLFIDYKSGECSAKSWEGERPDEPQLPIYTLAAPAPVAGVFFGGLKVGKMGFVGIAEREGLVPRPSKSRPRKYPPLPETIADWQRVLDGLGSDFLAGRAAVNPKSREKTCEYCALPGLCRIGDATDKSGRNDA